MNNKEDFYKSFEPELSPKQMLEYGVFGGSYLGDTIKEYPKAWFTKPQLSKSFDRRSSTVLIKTEIGPII